MPVKCYYTVLFFKNYTIFKMFYNVIKLNENTTFKMLQGNKCIIAGKEITFQCLALTC